MPKILAIDDGHGHLRAIPCGGPDVLRGVGIGVEIALDGLHLEHALLARDHVVVDGGGRVGQGVEVVAHPRPVILGRADEAGRVGGLVRINDQAVVAGPVHDANLAQPITPLVDGQVVFENLHRFDEHIITGGDQRLPGGLVCTGRHGRGHDPEVSGLPVGENDKATVVVGDLILVLLLAGQHRLKVQACIIGAGKAVLGLFRAVETDVEKLPGFAAPDAHVEGVVRLLVDQPVFAGLTQAVLAHALAEQCRRVFLDIKHRGIVGRPDQVGIEILDRIVQPLARLKILDAQAVLTPTDGVFGHGHEAIVGADLVITQPVEIVSLGAVVLIEQDFLGGIHAAFAARHDRVVTARLEAGVVPVAVVVGGRAGIVALQPGHDLFIKGFAELRVGREFGFGVGVFCFQIGQYIRVLALVVSQPVVRINTVSLRGADDVFAAFGNRRHGFGGSLGLGGRGTGTAGQQ